VQLDTGHHIVDNDDVVTATTHASTTTRALRWGVAFGVAQAAVAMAFWWLEPSTVHALMVTLIAAVYIGFAVADGRTNVIMVESAVDFTVAGIIAAQLLFGVNFQS
jgi:hypothetical protein